MKIKYVSYGTGNRVGNIIYLNKNLKKFPKLHKAILNHEKKHSGDFTFNDFWMDVKSEDLKEVKDDLVRFYVEYPKSLLNFFPVLKLDGKWYIDISLTILWILIIILFSLIWYLT